MLVRKSKSFAVMPEVGLTIYCEIVNNPGASSGALTYEKTEIERSKLRGIQPGRPSLMNKNCSRFPQPISNL
jgi:hypothetical protein